MTEESVKKAVKDSNRIATEELLTEAQRRMPQIRQLVKELLAGMQVPFSDEDLSKRFKRLKSSDLSYLDARQMLFTCGFVGLMLTPRSTDAARHLTTILPDENRRIVRYQDSRSLLPRWFWYHYNCDGDISSQFDQLAGHDNADVQFVLHPKTFEYLYPGHITKDFPIGI